MLNKRRPGCQGAGAHHNDSTLQQEPSQTGRASSRGDFSELGMTRPVFGGARRQSTICGGVSAEAAVRSVARAR